MVVAMLVILKKKKKIPNTLSKSFSASCIVVVANESVSSGLRLSGRASLMQGDTRGRQVTGGRFVRPVWLDNIRE